jgi:hypothetical protein
MSFVAFWGSLNSKWSISNAAEEEAISDGAERVLNFSILYTHPPTPTPTHILPYLDPHVSNLDRTIGLAGREENVYLGPERTR